jgi:arginine decarboxylase
VLRLVNVFNTESCWLVSVDGAEATPEQWQILEGVLAAKRSRNDRLPIFLFGDERTAEMVPASVLKHANAFMRLFGNSAEFLARAIARSAQLYLERNDAPDRHRADAPGQAGSAEVQGVFQPARWFE